jgi:lipoprotein-anchoring transpeptidase ErfK/SrfK
MIATRFIEITKSTCTLTAYADVAKTAVVAGPWSCTIGANPDGADKRAEGDCRTPEGRHLLVSAEDSTDWRANDEPAYGPRFLRLQGQEPANAPWVGIGIHGTCHPEELGRQASHGCVRLANDHVLTLSTLVVPGETVVVILP